MQQFRLDYFSQTIFLFWQPIHGWLSYERAEKKNETRKIDECSMLMEMGVNEMAKN